MCDASHTRTARLTHPNCHFAYFEFNVGFQIFAPFERKKLQNILFQIFGIADFHSPELKWYLKRLLRCLCIIKSAWPLHVTCRMTAFKEQIGRWSLTHFRKWWLLSKSTLSFLKLTKSTNEHTGNSIVSFLSFLLTSEEVPYGHLSLTVWYSFLFIAVSTNYYSLRCGNIVKWF